MSKPIGSAEAHWFALHCEFSAPYRGYSGPERRYIKCQINKARRRHLKRELRREVLQ